MTILEAYLLRSIEQSTTRRRAPNTQAALPRRDLCRRFGYVETAAEPLIRLCPEHLDHSREAST